MVVPDIDVEGLCGGGDGLEDALLAVFLYVIPGEDAAVHDDMDTRRKELHGADTGAQVEQSVGAEYRIGDHGPGEDDGFIEVSLRQ